MPSPRPQFAKAVALKSLELAARLWPDESRHWGQALLAEAHEITHPVEALFWALGGATVFLRSHLSHQVALLKLPPGRTTIPLRHGHQGPRFPHNSRLVTALLLLAVVLLLLLPPGREATSIISSSWRDFDATPADTRVVERLAAKAERDHDAHQLAFFANCEPDPGLSEKFAGRAVELDPTLFWIYAGRYRRPADTVDKEWLRRMQSYDADNAFVHILAAQAAVDPTIWSKFGLDGPNPGETSEIPGYAEWSANMQRASQASRYDSYTRRHLELSRTGWKQSPEVPVSLVAFSLWSHLLPDVSLIQKYVDQRIRQAQLAAGMGRSQEAEQNLREIATFGQRMIDGSETDFERLGALEIARRSQDALRKFYAQPGRQVDGQVTAVQLHAVETAKDNLRNEHKSWKRSLDSFRKRAILVQISASSALILAALTILSLFLLEFHAIPWQRFRRLRWAACHIADLGPAAVLVLCGTFLFSFRPFAFAMEQYRSTIASNATVPDFIWQLSTLGFMWPVLCLFQPSTQAADWLLLIVALSMIAVTIVVRGIWRHVAHLRTARR